MITLDQKPSQSDRDELVDEARRIAENAVSQTVERSQGRERHTSSTRGASAAEVLERVHEVIEVSAPLGVDKQELRRNLCLNIATVAGVAPEERSFERDMGAPGVVEGSQGPQESPVSDRTEATSPFSTSEAKQSEAINGAERAAKRRPSLLDGLL